MWIENLSLSQTFLQSIRYRCTDRLFDRIIFRRIYLASEKLCLQSLRCLNASSYPIILGIPVFMLLVAYNFSTVFENPVPFTKTNIIAGVIRSMKPINIMKNIVVNVMSRCDTLDYPYRSLEALCWDRAFLPCNYNGIRT